MFGKARTPRRRSPVSISSNIKTCLGIHGMPAVMDSFANEPAAALEREWVRE